jgi:hypothetical protein
MFVTRALAATALAGLAFGISAPIASAADFAPVSVTYSDCGDHGKRHDGDHGKRHDGDHKRHDGDHKRHDGGNGKRHDGGNGNNGENGNSSRGGGNGNSGENGNSSRGQENGQENGNNGRNGNGQDNGQENGQENGQDNSQDNGMGGGDNSANQYNDRDQAWTGSQSSSMERAGAFSANDGDNHCRPSHGADTGLGGSITGMNATQTALGGALLATAVAGGGVYLRRRRLGSNA